MGITIVDVARTVLPNAVAIPNGQLVTLKLDDKIDKHLNRLPSISYPTEYNRELVTINSVLSKKVGFAFRKFAEKIIIDVELQTKIQKIFEKHKNPPTETNSKTP